jgi:hypothetical protein
MGAPALGFPQSIPTGHRASAASSPFPALVTLRATSVLDTNHDLIRMDEQGKFWFPLFLYSFRTIIEQRL